MVTGMSHGALFQTRQHAWRALHTLAMAGAVSVRPGGLTGRGPTVRRIRAQRTFTGGNKHMEARSAQTLINDLNELVAALDRRVPRLEREGERDIVRDAQELRRVALERVAELERSFTPPPISGVKQETA